MKLQKSRKFIVRLSAILSITSISVQAQNNCPSLPKRGEFDTLTFIKTEIPTDPTKAPGIWLGQGTILRNGIEKRPAFIPSNRPTWAIAIAHAWNYHRNIIKRVNYPKIGYWMATLVQESELGCVDNNTWDAPYKVSANQANALVIMNHTGCYQIEGPGSAYGQLNQNYPFGRFPISSYKALMEGRDNMETSSLVKSYFDVYTPYVYNYFKGWKLYESIDCTKDPLAYEKSSAAGYNGGINAFAGASGFFNRSQDNNACWTGFPATTAGYGEDVAKWISVLEQMTSYCQYPTGSTFDSYYNVAIKWSDITTYLTIINKIYPEINFASQVTPNVQKAFEKIAGSTSGTIPFQQLGPVVDQIILSLPAEYPQTVEGSPIGTLKCTGKTIPYGHFEILNGSNNFCLGNSVTLNLVVDGGGGTATTFKWYKGSVSPANQIATTQSVTITPTTTGTFVYAAEICNADGCYQVNTNSSTSGCLDSRNILGVQIKVNQCSSCSTVVSATSVNTPCKGMAKGQINLAITNPPSNYKVSYTGTTPTGNFSGSFNSTGSTASIKNVRDGAYNIIIEDLANGTCKAYTNVIVGFTTLINEYVKAQITSTAACKANLQADIVKLPAPCRWKVEAFVPIFFQWENWMNIGVTTSSGASSLEKWTNFYPKPSVYDQYSDAQVFEGYYYLATGESMTIKMAVTNTPGASQLYSYRVNIYDDANTLVKTYNVPAGSAKGDQPYTVGTYTVTCPYTPPNAYNFAWNPTINNQTNTSSKSTGNVNVSSTDDVVYTVTATNATNPQCVLNDSVKVLKDPSCVPACTKPTDVISLNATNSVLSGCSPTTGKIETNTLTNGLAYQWYYDGGSGYTAYTGAGNSGTVSGNKVTLSSLSQNGKYKLRLVGLASDINTSACYIEQSFTVSITPTPSKPSISGTSTYCETNSIALSANKGNAADVVTNWDWKVGATTLSGSTSSYSKPNAVIADGGSYTLVAKNGSCPSTASDPFALSVTANPTFTITNPSAQCGGSVDLANTYSNLSAGTMKYYSDALATTLLGSSIVSTNGSYYLQSSSGICKSTIQAVVVSFNSQANPPTVQAVSYCKDATATALTATGTSLKWYADNLTTSSIPTPTPNTATVGSTDYFVSQTVSGCESNRSKLTVTINPLPNTNLTSSVSQCGGTLDLSTLSTATGTKKFYTDTLSSELSNTVVSNSGTYYLQVTSASGCKSKYASGKMNVQINTPPAANITTSGSGLTYCQNASGVTLTASQVSGANYEWFKDGASQGASTTSNTFSNATKGSWTVKVTLTSTNCNSTSTSATVVENPRPIITNSSLSQTICSGNASTGVPLTSDITSTFAWTSSASAGTITGFSASGSGNIPTQTITNSGATQGTVTYQIVPTANGCNGVATNYIIRIDPNPSANVSSTIIENCSSTQTLPGIQPVFGTVTWKKLSGKGTIDKPDSYNSNLSGLNPGESGTFQMEVSNGVCPVAKSAVVTVTRTADESPSISLSVDKSQVCKGSQVVFTANANGGNTATRTFTFFDAKTPTVILQAPSTNNKYIINASAPISVQVQMTANSACLATGANDTPISVAASVQVDNNPQTPSAGTGKSICADQFTLEGSAPVPASAVGKWSLLSGSGTFVNISSPNTVVKDIAEGANTYRWEVTNGQCPPVFADVTITRFTNPTIANAGTNQTLCENSTLNLNANPANASKGETGKWSAIGLTFADATKPNTSIANTTKGIHVLEWSIGNGVCQDSKDTMTIYVDAKPSIAALTGNSIIQTCANPTNLSAKTPTIGMGTWTKINSTENGNISSSEEANPSASVSGLVNGSQVTFRWTVTNGTCTDPSNYIDQSIQKLSDLTAAEISQNGNNLSENQELEVCLSSNSFSLTSSSPNFDEQGSWKVNGTSLALGDSQSTNPIISLNNTGKTFLTWSMQKQLGGTCPASTRTIIVSVIDKPTTSGSVLGDISVCANTIRDYSYPLENNATSYLWSIPAGASIVSGNTSNTVSIQLGDASGSLTVTPQNQCGIATSPVSLSITVKTIPTESVSIIGDFTPCASQTAEAYQASSVAAGVSYVWTSTIGNLSSSLANASVDFSTATATSGSLKVQLSNECGLGNSDTQPIQIVNALVPSVQLSSDKAGDKFCIGEATVTLTATATNGGNSPTYAFTINGTPLVASNNIVSLTPTELGSGVTVLVEMVSNESCLANPSNNKASATLELKGIKGPKPSLATNIDKVCEDDPTGILLTASGLGDLPVSYQWLKDGNLLPTANNNSSIQLTQVSQSGTYSVRMDDGICSASTSIASPFLTITPRPLIETLPKVEADISTDGKTPVFLNAKVSPASSILNWTGDGIVGDKDKNTLTLALSKEAVYQYTITATDNNCSSVQRVEVVAKLPLKIPNAFTPNGDGLNDTWTFVGLVDYAYLKVTVFNRWGGIVFRKEGEQVPPWDGSTNQGGMLETGTYYYLLEVRKNNGQNITLDGSVTILQ